MTTGLIGSIILWLIVAIIVISVVVYLLNWLYHRSTKEVAFVRTGLEGYLADLILVDGDPLSDVRILQDPKRLISIMKDGKFHKTPQNTQMGIRSTF